MRSKIQLLLHILLQRSCSPRYSLLLFDNTLLLFARRIFDNLLQLLHVFDQVSGDAHRNSGSGLLQGRRGLLELSLSLLGLVLGLSRVRLDGLLGVVAA